MSMTASATSEVYFDPYDPELNADPYLMFRRLREEAPLYYNEQHDFYAVSRFDEVNAALVDHETFSSARGAILELIQANIDIPKGVVIFEDPPIHDIHRKLLSRMFTPRKINELEPKIREFCAPTSKTPASRRRPPFAAGRPCRPSSADTARRAPQGQPSLRDKALERAVAKVWVSPGHRADR
jgi:cytochrome P450